MSVRAKDRVKTFSFHTQPSALLWDYSGVEDLIHPFLCHSQSVFQTHRSEREWESSHATAAWLTQNGHRQTLEGEKRGDPFAGGKHCQRWEW